MGSPQTQDRGDRDQDRGDRDQDRRSRKRDRSASPVPSKSSRRVDNRRDRDREDRGGGRHDRKREREHSSPADRHHRHQDDQPSRDHQRRNERNGRDDRDRGRSGGGRNNRRRRSNSFDHSNATWGKNSGDKSSGDKKNTTDKQKPNFGLSGKLTEEKNTFCGVVVKYSEPPEARKPRRRWRLYPFKGEKALQTLYIHRESAYLIGRDRKVVDLAVDHPSCSKQHAALQYRLVPFTRDDGSTGKRVRPYLIDLESANGTFINDKRIDAKRYVELMEKDVIKFGFSSREYVLLHENSKDEGMDDDVKQEDEEATAAVKAEKQEPE